MQMKGLKRLLKLCDAIGLKTLGELKEFYQNEAQPGEAVQTTLERYYKELNS